MRLTFLVPDTFKVFGIPQRERPPCLIECPVVELIRERTTNVWAFRRFSHRAGPWRYIAYARLPDWVTAPEIWNRLPTGEVALDVPLRFNPHVQIPEFPAGATRVRVTPDVPC